MEVDQSIIGDRGEAGQGRDQMMPGGRATRFPGAMGKSAVDCIRANESKRAAAWRVGMIDLVQPPSGHRYM